MVTASVALIVVGRPIGQALPGLIQEAIKTKEWMPVTAALVALGLLAAPVPTLDLAKTLAGRFLPSKKE